MSNNALVKKFSTFVGLLRYIHGMERTDVKFFSRHAAKQWGLYEKKSFPKMFEKVWKLKRAHFELTDIDNGKRFAEDHYEAIRYCEENDTWFVWDNIRWRQMMPKAQKVILQKAEQTVNKIRIEAESMSDGERKKKLTAYWKQCHSYANLKSMVRAATLDDRVAIEQKDLDSHPNLLTCSNYILDLKNPSKLWPHDHSKFLTQAIPHAFNPEAKCKRWEAFIEYATGNDKSLMRFIQIVAGYILTGEVREKSLIVLLGKKDTGKTLFLETMRMILGEDFAQSADFRSFLKTSKAKEIRNDIAGFRKARMVTAAEASGEDSFDGPVIKMLTGGDAITARFLRQEYIRFKATFKIVLATNEMPTIPLSDEAAWGRFIIIPFDKQPDADTMDRDLPGKFKEEAEGILAWAVEGARLYYEEGFDVPIKVQNAKDKLRGEFDPVINFMSECCKDDPKAKTTTARLFKAWVIWCDKNGCPAGTKSAFGKRLVCQGHKNIRIRVSVKGEKKMRRAWAGIKLTT